MTAPRYRATVAFRPDEHGTLADAHECAESTVTLDRWGKVLEELYQGAQYMDLEIWCPESERVFGHRDREPHGWEEICRCDDCEATICEHVAAQLTRDGQTWRCEDCLIGRAEDIDCRCPGGHELGPCHCPACVGLGAPS